MEPRAFVQYPVLKDQALAMSPTIMGISINDPVGVDWN